MLDIKPLPLWAIDDFKEAADIYLYISRRVQNKELEEKYYQKYIQAIHNAERFEKCIYGEWKGLGF